MTTPEEPASRREEASRRPPSLARQAWNLARSLAEFVADGLETVSADAYRRRLEMCDGCDRRRGNRAGGQAR